MGQRAALRATLWVVVAGGLGVSAWQRHAETTLLTGWERTAWMCTAILAAVIALGALTITSPPEDRRKH